jgi:hypothetical protein
VALSLCFFYFLPALFLSGHYFSTTKGEHDKRKKKINLFRNPGSFPICVKNNPLGSTFIYYGGINLSMEQLLEHYTAASGKTPYDSGSPVFGMGIPL